MILLIKIYFCRRGRRSNLDNGKKEPPQSFYQRKLSRKTSLEDRERSKRRSSITSVPAAMKDTNLNRQTSNSLTSLPRGHLDKRKTKEPKNHNKKIRSHENLHSTKNSKQSSGKKLYRQKTVSTSQDFLHSSRHIGIVSIVVYFYSTNAKRCYFKDQIIIVFPCSGSKDWRIDSPGGSSNSNSDVSDLEDESDNEYVTNNQFKR